MRSLLAPNGHSPIDKFIISTNILVVSICAWIIEAHGRQGTHAHSGCRRWDGDPCHLDQPGLTKPGNSWKITAGRSEKLTWKEEACLELEGNCLGLACSGTLPGVEWGTFYVSQLWDISGTCEGPLH